MCGLSGSGKSTVGSEIAVEIAALRRQLPETDRLFDILPSVMIRSDCVRKHLGDIPLDQRGPASIYTEQFTDKTYSDIQAKGLQMLSAGWTVVFDAKYDQFEKRESLRQACVDQDFPVAIVHVHAPRDVRSSTISSSISITT